MSAGKTIPREWKEEVHRKAKWTDDEVRQHAKDANCFVGFAFNVRTACQYLASRKEYQITWEDTIYDRR